MSPTARWAGAARAIAGLCVLAAVAAAPVVAKGVLEDEDPRARLVVVAAQPAGGGVSRRSARPSPVTRRPAAKRRAEPRRRPARRRAAPARRPRRAAERAPQRPRKRATPRSPRAERKRPAPPAPSRPKRPAPPPPPPPRPVSRQFAGDAVDTQYGTFQFAIVVRDGRIVEVRDLQVPGGKRTEEINATALPQLRAQTIERQSAAVDVISGATTTCEAFRLSVQAAVEQMR